ncbi:ATP-NAD kinase-like domain-containing protein [Zychaea mexicana]|uniref:ATP-NAD kinase-like domain-containing protein n=1 Tax=Zychaea mexicana TaxID=64656 RepID=UPI0022FE2468|nr:ATP-NAD kinase-like domain-containing protein [Zychaea mexicana]KAI9488063.1 ATP-NAD kinase-like domain-containing protein [Zychaea mexicana]
MAEGIVHESKRHRTAGPAAPLTEQSITNLGNNLNIKHWMNWEKHMDTIMIMTKPYDNSLVRYTRQVAEWIITTQSSGREEPFTVYVDGHLENSKRFGYQELVKQNDVFKKHLKFWTPKLCFKSPEMFHLIILLGGDGTVLFTSWLFQTYVPPIIPFHLGSLSFLTPFPFKEYQKSLHEVFSGKGPRIALRMRLSCTIYRYVDDPDYCKTREAKQCAITGAIWTRKAQSDGKDMRCQWQLMETEWMKDHVINQDGEQEATNDEATQNNDDDDSHTRPIPCYTTVPGENFQVLNELVVDRGPSSYMATLELFGDEQHLCTVEADGLVIATPTGSTAYSLSAGGSLCHPCVPAILITPICAHTLNFRPMLLPHTTTVRVVVRSTARSTAYCSFDGKYRVELRRGDHISITFSRYAMPTISRKDTNHDWFESLQKCLMWSQRAQQKPFVVVESHKKKNKHTKRHIVTEEEEGGREHGDGQTTAKTATTTSGTNTPSTTTTTTTSESGSEQVFACIDQDEDPKKQKPVSDETSNQDDDEEDDQEDESFELVPWTEEELYREMMTLLKK